MGVFMLKLDSPRAVCLALSLLLAPLAAAQLKVGIIDSQKAMLETDEIKKAQAELEAQFKPKQDEIEKLQKELQDINDQLQKMQGKLTPQAERDLQVQGQRKQRDLQRATEDLQAEVDARRNEVLARVQRQMVDVVRKLAEEKGLDVVIDATDTIYFKPALDLTAEATAAYNKAHPVKTSP
jgi:outer membrane protein